MNTISSQIQHTQERHKDYKNLFSTVNICSQENGRNKNDSCVEKISACGHAGGNFLHQYQYGHDQNSCNGSRIPDFDSTSIQVFQAVPCSQDQQERKEKTVAVRETGWMIETMPYQIKNLKIKGKTERN